jgi:hypothetical protein
MVLPQLLHFQVFSGRVALFSAMIYPSLSKLIAKLAETLRIVKYFMNILDINQDFR